MAETNKPAGAKAAAPAPAGDHDRVTGLSIRKDGSLDQNNPEIIGDKDAAIEATKRQFAEMAVSAIDTEKRQELGLAATDDEPGPDALIDELKKAHDAAAAAGEKQAEALIEQLSRG